MVTLFGIILVIGTAVWYTVMMGEVVSKDDIEERQYIKKTTKILFITGIMIILVNAWVMKPVLLVLGG